MDSIRENRTKEDVICEIQLELSEDIENTKSIILVEGSDDISFVKGVFDENVVAIESFSGVHDVETLLEDPSLQMPNIIAIRDRDYMDTSMLMKKMFLYDCCCLELMLLNNSYITKRFYELYYRGSKGQEDYIVHIMKCLAPFSMLRKKNAVEGNHINFHKFGFGDLVKINEMFDMQVLFERARQSETVYEECVEEAGVLSDGELWNITNGHDMCRYLGEVSKIGKANLGETGVRKILLGMFRKEDFRNTELYQAISEYQEDNDVHFVS